MATLTARMISEVGSLEWVIEDLINALENVPEAERRKVRLARALLAGVHETVKPGVCHRRMVWTMLDLMDAAELLDKLGYADHAASARQAQAMVTTLIGGMENSNG